MNPSPLFIRFLIVLSLVAGLVGARRLLDSFAGDELYRKDFMQEYVLAKAVVDGENIYAGLPELVGKYFTPTPEIRFEHPTPHTPVAAVLSVPIGWFPYPMAAAIWMAVELVCLAAALELLVRWWGTPVAVWRRGVLFLMCLGFGPVIRELWCGQFSLVMLVLMLLVWLLLRMNRDFAGGAILGFALALKLFVWPIGIYLLLRRWRAALAAGVVAVAAHAAVVPVVGWSAVVDYYTRVGPLVARQHRENDENFSLWTVGPRLFSEASQPEIASTFIASPPLPSARLERIVAVGLPIIILVGVLFLAWRCQQFDSAFGILLCASLPLNPVAWDHYLLLTAIPIAIVVRRLAAAGSPRGMTLAAAAATLITIVPNPAYLKWMAHMFAVGRVEPYAIVPFAAGLITFLPLVPLAIWTAILLKTDRDPRYGTVSTEFVPPFSYLLVVDRADRYPNRISERRSPPSQDEYAEHLRSQEQAGRVRAVGERCIRRWRTLGTSVCCAARPGCAGGLNGDRPRDDFLGTEPRNVEPRVEASA